MARPYGRPQSFPAVQGARGPARAPASDTSLAPLDRRSDAFEVQTGCSTPVPTVSSEVMAEPLPPLARPPRIPVAFRDDALRYQEFPVRVPGAVVPCRTRALVIPPVAIAGGRALAPTQVNMAPEGPLRPSVAVMAVATRLEMAAMRRWRGALVSRPPQILLSGLDKPQGRAVLPATTFPAGPASVPPRVGVADLNDTNAAAGPVRGGPRVPQAVGAAPVGPVLRPARHSAEMVGVHTRPVLGAVAAPNGGTRTL